MCELKSKVLKDTYYDLVPFGVKETLEFLKFINFLDNDEKILEFYKEARNFKDKHMVVFTSKKIICTADVNDVKESKFIQIDYSEIKKTMIKKNEDILSLTLVKEDEKVSEFIFSTKNKLIDPMKSLISINKCICRFPCMKNFDIKNISFNNLKALEESEKVKCAEDCNMTINNKDKILEIYREYSENDYLTIFTDKEIIIKDINSSIIVNVGYSQVKGITLISNIECLNCEFRIWYNTEEDVRFKFSIKEAKDFDMLNDIVAAIYNLKCIEKYL